MDMEDLCVQILELLEQANQNKKESELNEKLLDIKKRAKIDLDGVYENLEELLNYFNIEL